MASTGGGPTLVDLARLGAGGAARALGRLLGSPVEVTPAVRGGRLEEFMAARGGPALPATAVSLRVMGLPGCLLLLLPGGSAGRLASLLLGDAGAGDLSEEGRSAVQESANIIASAYLTEVGRAARIELLPSVPHLIRGRLDALLELPLEMLGARADEVTVLAAELDLGAGHVLTLAHFVVDA